MDRGACRAMVHSVTESDTTEVTEQTVYMRAHTHIYVYMSYDYYHHCTSMSHDYNFSLTVGIIKISSLSKFDAYNAILYVFTILYICF